MSQTIQEFWAEVREARKEIELAIMNQAAQPHDGKSCFLVSKRDRKSAPDLRSGVVVEATIHLAGKLLVEGSHELATDDQIATWHASQAEARKTIARLEATRKASFLVSPAAVETK
jgi:hypothetical protein